MKKIQSELVIEELESKGFVDSEFAYRNNITSLASVISKLRASGYEFSLESKSEANPFNPFASVFSKYRGHYHKYTVIKKRKK